MIMEHGPLLGQIYVQVSYAAMFLIARVVLTQGMSYYLFVFYRQAIATVAIAPFAYVLESDQRSKLTLRNVGKISLLALLGITISQNFYYAGLSLTSTTLATTMNNINPAFTFVMAVALRLERLDLWTWRGQAKVWGTVLCVGGAMIMTLFKGPRITFLGNPPAVVLPAGFAASESPLGGGWILGALLLAGGVWAWSACVIYQAWILGDCPSQLTTTAVMCWMGALQSALVALLFERLAAWRLNWDLQLLTICYSGIFCSAFGFFVQLWVVKEKGPLFATVFSPLSTVLVGILEPLLFRVPLHWEVSLVPSLAGMVMVIGGLYFVLWGKAMEGKDEKTITSGASAVSLEADDGTREPLLTQTTGDQIEA